MKNLLAYFFRESNWKLIYPQALLLLKFRKLIFYFSNVSYRYWIKRIKKSNLIVVDNIDGDILMEVDTSKVIGAAFYWTGFHEFREWRCLHNLLTSDMVFLDVGANQGEYALFAAKRLTNGRVIAFEPVNEIYCKLEYNIAINGFTNVETYNLGLSNAQGIEPIYKVKNTLSNNEGLATLYQTESRGELIQKIKLDRLDNLISDIKLTRLDFIKVDIEGAELSMLQGAQNSIQQFRPKVMIEMNDETFKAAGYSKMDIVNFFDSVRYRAYGIGKHGSLYPIVSIDNFVNVIFVPQ